MIHQVVDVCLFFFFFFTNTKRESEREREKERERERERKRGSVGLHFLASTEYFKQIVKGDIRVGTLREKTPIRLVLISFFKSSLFSAVLH